MAEKAAGDGLLGWLVGGVLVGIVVLGLVVASYAVGYRRGEDAARPTTTAETPPATTQPAETATAPQTTPSSGGDATSGKAVFASAGCGSCHTLADAGTTGAVGPNLDVRKPTEAQVKAIVSSGRDGMPSFGGLLDAGQIDDVAAYVSTVAGA